MWSVASGSDATGRLRATRGRVEPTAAEIHAPFAVALQLLAGTLRDGDHVDLIATLQCGNGCEFTRVVLRNMKVLQGPGSPAAGSKLTGTNQNFSVMLAMTDSQTQKFQHVLSNRSADTTGAGWHLAMRPVVHDADSPESITTVWTILRDGLSPAWIKRYLSRLRGGN